jgi:outer membrane protein OmpA-like peptidoglycan-associated protein
MKLHCLARLITSLSAVGMLLAGCVQNPEGGYEFKRTGIGAAGGAALGAGAGALLSGRTHRGRNAAIGGLTGAVVGGAVGNYMDRQAAALKKSMPEAEVVRDADKVYVALPSGILFDINKDKLKPAAKESLQKAAATLRDSQTNIVVEGHTDSTGSDEINQPLSQRRANRVRDFLISQGIAASRLSAIGYGASRPAVPNDSEANRALNRRVQLQISPNAQLKAQEGRQ